MTKDEVWLLKEKYHGEKNDAFFADCARLETGEPLAYIIGYIPFLDSTIYLDSRPLIPRPETEYWVEKAITAIKSTLPRVTLGLPSGKAQVLDLCAGSGAIGVAVAKAVPEAAVTFVEIDPTHLPTIKKNLVENTIIYESTKYPILESDLFSNITGSFDFILTNPPYIDKEAKTVEASVTNHEPQIALFGGVAGLEIIESIIEDANNYLNPGGQIWIEHEPFQSGQILNIAKENGFSAVSYPDQYDTMRYSVLAKAVAK